MAQVRNLILVECSKSVGRMIPIGGFGSELNNKRMEIALSIAASALSLATKREPVSSETGNETTDNPGTNQPRQLKQCLICLAQDAAGRWCCSVLLSIVLESSIIIMAASFTVWQSKTILARSCEAGQANRKMAIRWQWASRSLA